MANAKTIEVKESLKELKAILKKQTNSLMKNRILMLIHIKTSDKALSKNELAGVIGVNHNSIQKWRKLYEQGGITTLLKQTRGGKTREVITAAVHQSIEKRLTSSTNAFTSYKALQEWIDEKFIPGVKYITVVNYVKRKFHTKLKVARKSHIHKDANAVEAFKKNRRTV